MTQINSDNVSKKDSMDIECRDFSRGICPRAEKCVYTHKPSHQSVRAFPKQFYPTRATIDFADCEHFLSGSCPRADLCWFRHPRTSVSKQTASHNDLRTNVLQTMARHNEYCEKYSLQGYCRHGSQCSLVHLPPPREGNPPKTQFLFTNSKVREYCHRFVSGKRCPDGENCAFVHPAPRLENHDPDGILILRTKATVPEYCRNYQRGSCTRGKTCNFIHFVLVPPAGPLPADTLKPTITSTAQGDFMPVSAVSSERPQPRSLGFDHGVRIVEQSDEPERFVQKIDVADLFAVVKESNTEWGGSWMPDSTDSWGPIIDPANWAESEQSSDTAEGFSTDSFSPASDPAILSSDITLWPSRTQAPQSAMLQASRLADLAHPPAVPTFLPLDPPGVLQDIIVKLPPSNRVMPPAASTPLASAHASGSDVLSYSASNSDIPQILTLHEHIRVKFSAGFDIQEVVTGFETPWLHIRNVPGKASAKSIARTLKSFGNLQDLKIPTASSRSSASVTVRARFSSGDEARLIRDKLSRTKLFGNIVEAWLPISVEKGPNMALNDTTVRIVWEAPRRVAYGGYPDEQCSERAISAAMTYEDRHILAHVHHGLPALGPVTVKFEHLPPTADSDLLQRFAQPEAVMFEKPNYTSKNAAIQGIKRLISNGLQSFELWPDVRPGILRAYAHFSSPSLAQAAAQHLHNRKPAFTGLTKIYAQRFLTISFSVGLDIYTQVQADLYDLKVAAWSREDGSYVAIHHKPNNVLVRIGASDVKALGQLKAQAENILRGEVVVHEGQVVWDRFFTCPAGIEFLNVLHAKSRNLILEANSHRRKIRLFGPRNVRAAVRLKILSKWRELLTRRRRTILLNGRFIGSFLHKELPELQSKYGPDNVYLDLFSRTLHIRGPELVYDSVLGAVRTAEYRLASAGRRARSEATCPICLHVVDSKVVIDGCGHSACRSCLVDYLRAAINCGYFPLTCLGSNATCTSRIPLSLARRLLPADQYEAIAEAALAAYVAAHAEELRYCPTPDCSQIYRSAAEGTVLQCPSCLARICPHCHVLYHDDTPCAPAVDGDAALEDWAQEHHAKRCPGCDILIERTEGCNHVTCTRCRTHICWFCMKTFPNGDGIYAHMHQSHGSFGVDAAAGFN